MAEIKPQSIPKGMKSEDFVSLDKLIGDEAESVGGMPQSVHFYIKEQLAFLYKRNAKFSIYRIEKNPGEQKETLAFLEDLSDIPEEEYLKSKYGGGRYRWIARWTEEDGRKGVLSEPISIANDFRVRPESMGGAPQFQAPATVSAPSNTSNVDPYELSLRMFDRMGAMMERLIPKRESGLELVDRLAEKLAMMSMKQYERDLKLGENVKKTLIESVKAQEDFDEEKPSSEIAIPAWLKPFVPVIQEAIPALLGGGLTGKFAKTALLGSDDFTQIMQDPERWNELLKAISGMYPDGAEKVMKIVEILNAPAPDPNTVNELKANSEAVTTRTTKAKTK